MLVYLALLAVNVLIWFSFFRMTDTYAEEQKVPTEQVFRF